MHLYIFIMKLYILYLILIFPTPTIPASYMALHKDKFRKNRKAQDSVNWERLFNKKGIDAQVAVFNETILNAFRKYVPNITIDGKDLLWMNKTIKLNIKAKNNVYNKYIENGRFEIGFSLFETLINELNKLINTAKLFYY